MTEALATNNGSPIASAPAGLTLGGELHPIVRALLSQNPSVETLERLLAVQKEWDAENARRAFTAALTAAKAEITTVVGKDKTVDYTNNEGRRTYYKHASLGAVIDAVTAPLAKHGLSLSWKASTGKDGVTVAAVLTHVAGHSMTSDPLSAPPDDSGRKSKAQAVASTTTLLSRYTAMALLGLASGDMDEDQPSDAPVNGAGARQRSPGEQAASKQLDDALTAFAAAKDADAVRAAWKLAASLPEKERARAWEAWTKHAARVGLKPKGKKPDPAPSAGAEPWDDQPEPGSEG
jgi:hypothetical protein